LFSISLNSQTPVTGYKILDTATDFKLKGVDGKMYSLASFKNTKGFLIIFTCNHCPFAQAYESRIIALHKKYAAKGIPVIAINPNDAALVPEDSYPNMVKRSKERKYPFVYLHDATQNIARAYGAKRTPHVFFLDAKRTIQYMGTIDDNFEEPTEVKEKYLENALDAFLAGKPIILTQTKAIGCGIRWRK
ncbi:MAG: thioredoxin family protein, partial [Bacteroidota bacterium]|nr:thioredoxin family protein [Bacteroidota bacterium]